MLINEEMGSKSIVIMVAFLTFGLITPTHEIWEAFDQNPSNRASIGPSPGTSTAEAAALPIETEIQEEPVDYSALLVDAAKEQSYKNSAQKSARKLAMNLIPLSSRKWRKPLR